MSLALVCPGGDSCPSLGDAPASLRLVEHAHAGVRGALGGSRSPNALGDVEDLVQETLLRLWERYPESWGAYSRGLVNRVARSIVVDAARMRQAKKRDVRRDVALEEAVASASTDASLRALEAREELHVRLAACRAALSAEHWRAFVLLFVAGFTSGELARLDRCPSSRFDTAACRLRKQLAVRGITVLRRRGRGGAS